MQNFTWGAAALGLAGLLALPAGAQMSANPPEVGAGIAALGDRMGPEIVKAVQELYDPLHAAASTEGVTVTSDIAYGAGERQKLGLYVPDGLAPDARPPILIFAHGGGFVRGDKSALAHLGTYFARKGVVTALVNYGFAPQSTFPAGGEDLGLAVRWLRDNAGQHPGNTDAIFVGGNSAGATHAATYGFVTGAGTAGDGVRGLVLISTPTADAENLGPQDKVYYGEDASKYPEMSIIRRVGDRALPVFVGLAENEPPSIQQQNARLIEALFVRDGRLPVIETALGHNHYSIVEQFGTADEGLGPDILQFIARNTPD